MIPGLYVEASTEKEVPFSGFRFMKGKGFHLLKYIKRVGKSVIWVCGLKRLKDEFCGLKMSRKRSIFVLDSHLCIYSR